MTPVVNIINKKQRYHTMMVIFVSQCEKKALKRTRRVLDAFADRIGDNTWQTVITEEGLQAVKKLLRQTASKNTAVSCHWIRSRARSDLLWVVGQQGKFDFRGIVPVNYTTQEVIMDRLPIETSAILANTKKQPLSQHLFAVGFLAHQLLVKLEVNSPNLAQSAFIAGVLHDIGKIDPQFQQWLSKKIKKTTAEELPDDGVHIDTSVTGHSKFTFEKHPRHNEISWLLAQSLLKNDGSLNCPQKEQIFHGIYWHHTRPFRKDSKYFDTARGIHKLFAQSLKGITFDKVIDQVVAVLADTKKLAQNYQGENLTHLIPQWDYPFELMQADLPAYKIYDNLADTIEEVTNDIKPNALNNLIRMAVISADRMVSKLPADELAEYLADGTLANLLDNVMLDASSLGQSIKQCLQGFDEHYPNSERNRAQAQVAKQLAELQDIAECEESDNISVLQGPAGCGKTKIALEWAAKTDAQQIFWVCPRVQICLGLLNDLTQADYLPNSRIEIFTGEYKKILFDGNYFDDVPETAENDYFSGDIVITTIDQVINNIISHNKVTGMVDFMQAHVVFDEFHELIPMPAFNLLLAELVAAKKMRGHQANTLLVSATPNDAFVTKVLRIHNDDIIRMDSFNQADYQLEFKPYDETEMQSPLVSECITDDKTTFVISNTAQDAQLGFLLHQKQENNILLHSKYTKDDKAKYFNRVFESFKEKGTKDYQILRSGPIVQASLNISCECMLTELTGPENWLQRLGRLDRFDENSEVNIYTTVLPQSALQGKQSSSAAKFLNHQCIWHSTVAWLHYLQTYLQDRGDNIVKLNDLYQVYQKFYSDKSCQAKVEEDLIKALKESVLLVNDKLIDPISFMPKAKRKKEGVVKISKSSLRGNNCFVQLAVCEVDENLNPVFLNEYAYDENTDHSIVTIGLTEANERIQGYGDSERNLLAFMKAKHHNIKETAGKVYKDFILLSEARSPEKPIYLSYTPEDLQSIGGERERHPYAMYYVVTDKQSVGTMAINIISNPR